MTVRETMAEGRTSLEGHETDTASLDVALLLANVLGITREKLYMNLSENIAPSSLAEFRKAMIRRHDGEPVAWITGRKEFWGLEFSVGPGVLTPRPDSEVLIEEALSIMDEISPTAAGGSKPLGRLHDCCTGPGTLALTLAHERPGWDISASDISEDAEKYFCENNARLCAGKVAYNHADLMEGLDGVFNIIVSNPPYLTSDETHERIERGWKEPVLALDGGGNDGLDVIRRLIPRIFHRLVPGGALLIEADPLQMRRIGEILVNTGFGNPRIRRDLGERDRLIIAQRTE